MPDKNLAFSQILYEVTTGPNPIVSVSEAARVMSVSESTVYDYRQDRTEPSYSKIKSLSHLLTKRGYYKLSFQFYGKPRKADGSTKDETIEIVRQLGRISEATDGSTIINAAGEIEKQAQNLRAEGELL